MLFKTWTIIQLLTLKLRRHLLVALLCAAVRSDARAVVQGNVTKRHSLYYSGFLWKMVNFNLSQKAGEK